jgi:hypothetical protein
MGDLASKDNIQPKLRQGALGFVLGLVVAVASDPLSSGSPPRSG